MNQLSAGTIGKLKTIFVLMEHPEPNTPELVAKALLELSAGEYIEFKEYMGDAIEDVAQAMLNENGTFMNIEID